MGPTLMKPIPCGRFCSSYEKVAEISVMLCDVISLMEKEADSTVEF